MDEDIPKIKCTENHISIYHDCLTSTEIKEEIALIRDDYPEMIHKFSVDDVFRKKMAK